MIRVSKANLNELILDIINPFAKKIDKFTIVRLWISEGAVGLITAFKGRKSVPTIAKSSIAQDDRKVNEMETRRKN